MLESSTAERSIAEESMVVASKVIEHLQEEVDKGVQLKIVEQNVPWWTVKNFTDQARGIMSNAMIRYETKEDDCYLLEEQASFNEPDPKKSYYIPPCKTGQQKACNEFKPPKEDSHHQVTKVVKVPAPQPSIVEALDSESSHQIYSDHSSPHAIHRRKKSLYLKKIPSKPGGGKKRASTSQRKYSLALSLASEKNSDTRANVSPAPLKEEHQGEDSAAVAKKQSVPRHKVQADLLKMNIALKNTFKNLIEDGLTEIYIDQLRARIRRKEQNEKLNKAQKQQRRGMSHTQQLDRGTAMSSTKGNMQFHQTANNSTLSGINPKMMTSGTTISGGVLSERRTNFGLSQVTFDDKGHLMNIQPVKAEKLPKLMGQQPEIRDASHEMKQHASSKAKVSKKGKKETHLKIQTLFRKTESSTDKLHKDEESNQDQTTDTQREAEHEKDANSVNLDDPGLQVISDGNFNIKQNMKASFGIVYKEGTNYVDHGPSYIDKVRDGSELNHLTLQEYQEKFASQANRFKHRGLRDITAKTYRKLKDESMDFDKATPQADLHPGRPMHQTLQPEDEPVRAKTADGFSKQFQSLVRKRRAERSNIKVHSTHGHSDIFDRTAGFDSNLYLGMVKPEEFSYCVVKERSKGFFNRQDLPKEQIFTEESLKNNITSLPLSSDDLIDMGGASHGAKTGYYLSKMKSQNLWKKHSLQESGTITRQSNYQVRGGTTLANTENENFPSRFGRAKKSRQFSALSTINNPRSVGGSHSTTVASRVVTSNNELKMRQDLVQQTTAVGGKMFVPKTGREQKQNQLDLAQSSNAAHRKMVGGGMLKAFNKIESLPMFARDEMKGKISSQFGTRHKLERHLLKSGGGQNRQTLQETADTFGSQKIRVMTPAMDEPQMSTFIQF